MSNGDLIYIQPVLHIFKLNIGCRETGRGKKTHTFNLVFSSLWLRAAPLSKQCVNLLEDQTAAAGDQGSEGGGET